MFRIICVTNRRLSREDFGERFEKITKAHPDAIILREKDLSEAEYERLSEESLKTARTNDTLCILHTFWKTALKLKAEGLHMPLPLLREMPKEARKQFKILGASCHSKEDALEAEALGCTYITAGHIFETDCKKGVAPRGLDFLKEITESVSIPVYAIGGILPEHRDKLEKAGAVGACIMSSCMQCDDVNLCIFEFKENKYDI